MTLQNDPRGIYKWQKITRTKTRTRTEITTLIKHLTKMLWTAETVQRTVQKTLPEAVMEIRHPMHMTKSRMTILTDTKADRYKR